MSIYTMGIDVGSTASKCVILKDGSEIVAKSLVAVGTGTSGPSRAIAQVLENAGMTREQMDFVLATGYGRNSLDGLADMQMSELSCHAKGAKHGDHHNFPCLWPAPLEHHKEGKHSCYHHDQAAQKVFAAAPYLHREKKEQRHQDQHEPQSKPGAGTDFSLLFQLLYDHAIRRKSILF